MQAVGTEGRARSTIVISAEQAALLKQIDNSYDFLEKGRVVIVCN